MATQSLLFNINADNRQAIQAFSGLKSSVANVAAGIAGAFGVGLGMAGIVNFGRKVIETGDNIDKMSKRFGVGAEWIQKFMLMSDLSGVSIGEVDRALKGQAQSLVSAERGLETDRRAFRELGLETKTLLAMKPEDAFDAIARKLAGVSNETRRAALAQDIWGKSGTALLPMVKDYIELSREAADAVVFTDADVANAARFKDEVSKINTSLMGIAVESGFLGWLSDVANRLRESINLLKTQYQAKGAGTLKGFGVSSGAGDAATQMIADWGFGLGSKILEHRAIKEQGGKMLTLTPGASELSHDAILQGTARARRIRESRQAPTEVVVTNETLGVEARNLRGFNQ
jgi:hypothetical protein